MNNEFMDMTGRILKVGNEVAYVYVEYGKSTPECGGIGIVSKIDETRTRPVQVDFGEYKQSYTSNKLIIINK